ncbi:FKBP-type peptidyl-prolyl cis-trans isomerase [Marinomonas sp. 2405UD68-3]|uniref:FKBP-type peptidyl-prolyl cis-trans isomerase n=1 Tax=Marinomonas sp. 2405UD68-3 TaxID=3391835 RepID=UPI0039C9B7FD
MLNLNLSITVLALILLLSISSSHAHNINQSIAKSAADVVVSELLNSDERHNYDTEEMLEALRNALDNSTLYLESLSAIESEEGENFTRKQAEAMFIRSIMTYPFLRSTTTGILYQSIKTATNNTLPPKSTDKVRVNIDVRAYDGEVLLDEDNYVVRLNLIHSILSSIITNMTEGEEIKAFIPSTLMFGGNQYRNIPPYSTMIATIELIQIVEPTKY